MPTINDFEIGDLIYIEKPIHPSRIHWNSEDGFNMNYLTKGTHVVHEISEKNLYVYDKRIGQCWTLEPEWCTLAHETDRSTPYYKVIRKIKQLDDRRKVNGFAF
jgi:hypothetical protein